MKDLQGRERHGDWMQTASGGMFFPLDPRPADHRAALPAQVPAALRRRSVVTALGVLNYYVLRHFNIAIGHDVFGDGTENTRRWHRLWTGKHAGNWHIRTACKWL